MAVPPQQPPGWYPDPSGQGQRYWDGNAWTEHTAPAQGAVQTPPPPAGGPGQAPPYGQPGAPYGQPPPRGGRSVGKIIGFSVAGLVAIIVVIVVIVAVVGGKTIKSSSAENFLRQNLPGNPSSVKCPSGVEEKKGKSFDCKVDYPDGRKFTVTIHQTDNKGHVVFGPGDIKPR